MNLTLKQRQIEKICTGSHPDPFSFLGLHKSLNPIKRKTEFYIRAFIPDAKEVSIIFEEPNNESLKMEKLDSRGFFEKKLPYTNEPYLYRFHVTNMNESEYETYDPYSFDTVTTDYDIYLFNEGTHYSSYEKLGAHFHTIKNIKGVLFSVWAPNAKRVSVVGSFNNWDGRRHAMKKLGMSGIWEIFIPSVMKYDLYKFEIKTTYDEIKLKSDPFALYSELRPNTASVVYDLDNFAWSDYKWMHQRKSESSYDKPMSIYELHLGSFARDLKTNNFLNYKKLAAKLINYIKNTGYTHVEFLPISEHPFDGSWGYQVSGYFSPTSRFGTPEDLKYLINSLHKNGIGVIVDWVPAHFPKDAFALASFDGTCLYEYSNPLMGEHKDWGTLIFNYGRNEVKSFLISNAIYWFEKFHIDGLRVDAVASMLYLDYSRKEGEWIPNEFGGRENLEAIEFLKTLNRVVFSHYPNALMIAEESTAWPKVTHPVDLGGLGFSYKWNMGWMNDFLRYLSLDPIYRKYDHQLLTFSMMYHHSENFILPISHDEVVHGKNSLIEKIPGDHWQKFATLRAAIGFMYGHPGKKLLFMSNDIAQFEEWHFNQSIDWHLLDENMHMRYHRFLKDLNNLYTTEYAFFEKDYRQEGFEWINANDSDHSIISFVRYAKFHDNFLLFVVNFTPVVHNDYVVGVPYKSTYKEVINSDSYIYGGSNVGNLGMVDATSEPANSKPYSIKITVPPLSCVILKPIVKAST